MIYSLSFAPKIVERLLRVFPTDRLDERIMADRFTAREVIAHLAEYEQVVLDRIRAANASPGREVPAYDPDQAAEAHHYADKDVFHEAEVFESRRDMTTEYLEGLADADWDKTFKVNGSETSIKDYMAKIMAHDLEHMHQLSLYLATEVATIH